MKLASMQTPPLFLVQLGRAVTLVCTPIRNQMLHQQVVICESDRCVTVTPGVFRNGARGCCGWDTHARTICGKDSRGSARKTCGKNPIPKRLRPRENIMRCVLSLSTQFDVGAEPAPYSRSVDARRQILIRKPPERLSIHQSLPT